MKSKKGISLIVLVITIIVMIILAAAIILSLNNAGIIGNANEAVFKQDVKNYINSLALYSSDVYLENRTNTRDIYLDENSTPTIQQALSMSNSYAKKLGVESGELIYIGSNENEIKWCEEIGVKVGSIAKYELVYQTGGWEYETNIDGTITLTKYTGTDTEIVVPTRYRNTSSEEYKTVYGVTGREIKPVSLVYNMFDEYDATVSEVTTRITKVTITDGIKYIGSGAFIAFDITEITIPESVISIGCNAFAWSKISKVTFNAINCKTARRYGEFYPPFYACPLEEIVIGDKVKVIPQGMFYTVKGTEMYNNVMLGENVECIEPFAFAGAKTLTNIYINNKLEVLGANAFYNSALKKINYSGNFEDYRKIRLTENTLFESSTVTYTENIEMITTEVDGINWTYSIKNGVIENLHTTDSDLTGILVIPGAINGYKVRSIGKDYHTLVIANATSRANVTGIQIAEGIEEINDWAFYNSSALTGTLILPTTLKRIGYKAFSLTTGFTGLLEIPNSVESIGDYSFAGTNSSKMKFSSLSLGNGLKEIGDGAFQYCSNMKSELVLPEGLEKIGDWSFFFCSGFTNTKLTFPSTLKIIGGTMGVKNNTGYGATYFYGFATKCTTYEVAAGNNYFTSIDGVLYNKNITRLLAVPYAKKFTNNTFEIPEGVTQMDETAFNLNSSIKTLILPDSYEILEEDPPLNTTTASNSLAVALYAYTSVNNIQVKTTNPYYTTIDGCLYTKDGKVLVYVPKKYSGVLNIAEGTEYVLRGAIYTVSNNNITEINIPYSIKYIEASSLNIMNQLQITKNVDLSNEIYEIDSNGKIIKKSTKIISTG